MRVWEVLEQLSRYPTSSKDELRGLPGETRVFFAPDLLPGYGPTQAPIEPYNDRCFTLLAEERARIRYVKDALGDPFVLISPKEGTHGQQAPG